MKKYFLLFCISALVFTGCNQDELDIPQKGVVPVEDYYKTDEDAEAALAAMYLDSHKNFAKSDHEYNFGPLFGLTNFQSPDIYLAGSGVGDCVTQREFQQFRYTNTNALPLAAYTMFYRSIHKANIVINNFEAGTSNTMKRAVAEARVMRAYDHMMLGIYWGTPPIVTEVLTGAARPENAASQEAVMDWVANEIDLALPDLTERQGKTDRAGAVRITKGFAYAIKGKALLWKGDYTGAKTALKEVISSGNYELVPSEDMVKIGHADGKASSESVFEFNMVCDPAVVSNPNHKFRVGWNDHMTFNWRFENFNGPTEDSQINNNGWGWVNPTGDFARALIANDGMESARRKAWIKTYDEILYDHEWASDFTPIKDAEGNVIGKEPKNLTRAQKAVDPKRGVKADARIHANEGYFIWKNVPHVDQGDVINEGWAGTWNKNFQIMRYAEVLLMYAEACAQTPDASDDVDGLAALNAIQNRAGSKYVSTVLDLKDVKNEMRFELWLEGDRTVNLIRWGDTQQLKEVGSYMPDLRDALNYGKGSEHDVYIDASKATYYKDTYDIGFKPGKHELLPFPKRAVDLNSGLKQNPNWD
jgi:hypothetical protein